MNYINLKEESMEDRGTGRTTRQMQDALQGAVFIWCNGLVGRMSYVRELAHKIGRDDLEIVAPYWLEQERWRGKRMTGIVVDHAARLSPEQSEALLSARAWIR